MPHEEELTESVTLLATRRPGTLILGVFTPLSQLEPRFAAALNRAHLPALALPPERIPLIPTLLSALPISAVVSTAQEAPRIRDALAQCGVSAEEAALAASDLVAQLL